MKTVPVKYGIEIEGEYGLLFQEIVRNYGTLKGDGSVKHCSNIGKKCVSDGLNCAEFASKAIALDDEMTTKKIFAAFQAAYENKLWHYNISAGFHIHMSFLPELPPEIFSAEFAKFFKTALEKDYPDVIELRGTNSYCKLQYTEAEIAYGNVERYRFINFWPAFEKHHTIEFRIWPTNEPMKMLEYFNFTVNKVREFLAQPYRSTQSITIKKLDDIEEEIIEKVATRVYKSPTIIEQVSLFETELFF